MVDQALPDPALGDPIAVPKQLVDHTGASLAQLLSAADESVGTNEIRVTGETLTIGCRYFQ